MAGVVEKLVSFWLLTIAVLLTDLPSSFDVHANVLNCTNTTNSSELNCNKTIAVNATSSPINTTQVTNATTDFTKPLAAYELLANGSQCSANMSLLSRRECEGAARSLKLNDTSALVTASADMPRACYVNVNGELVFNLQRSGTAGADNRPICATGSVQGAMRMKNWHPAYAKCPDCAKANIIVKVCEDRQGCGEYLKNQACPAAPANGSKLCPQSLTCHPQNHTCKHAKHYMRRWNTSEDDAWVAIRLKFKTALENAILAANSTEEMVNASQSMVPPSQSMVPPSQSMVPPSQSMVPPSQSIVHASQSVNGNSTHSKNGYMKAILSGDAARALVGNLLLDVRADLYSEIDGKAWLDVEKSMLAPVNVGRLLDRMMSENAGLAANNFSSWAILEVRQHLSILTKSKCPHVRCAEGDQFCPAEFKCKRNGEQCSSRIRFEGLSPIDGVNCTSADVNETVAIKCACQVAKKKCVRAYKFLETNCSMPDEGHPTLKPRSSSKSIRSSTLPPIPTDAPGVTTTYEKVDVLKLASKIKEIANAVVKSITLYGVKSASPVQIKDLSDLENRKKDLVGLVVVLVRHNGTMNQTRFWGVMYPDALKMDYQIKNITCTDIKENSKQGGKISLKDLLTIDKPTKCPKDPNGLPGTMGNWKKVLPGLANGSLTDPIKTVMKKLKEKCTASVSIIWISHNAEQKKGGKVQRLGKFVVDGKKNPQTKTKLSKTSDVTFIPAQDKSGRIEFQFKLKFSLGNNVRYVGPIKHCFSIENENTAPKLHSRVVFLPSVPFRLAENLGFSVKDIANNNPSIYGSGKDNEKVKQAKKKANEKIFITDVDSPWVGIAITEVSSTSTSIGKWWFKADAASAFTEFGKQDLATKILRLTTNSSLKFVPTNANEFWKVSKAMGRKLTGMLTIRAWDGSDGLPAGLNAANTSSSAYSSSTAAAITLRADCGGAFGMSRKVDGCGECGGDNSSCKACDGNMKANFKGNKVEGGSNATFDTCNNCNKEGTAGWNSRLDRFKRCCKQTLGECNICEDARLTKGKSKPKRKPKDCNGDCFGAARNNSCNVCVKGKTDKPVDEGINKCGVCKSEGQSETDCQVALTGISRKNTFPKTGGKFMVSGVKGVFTSFACRLIGDTPANSVDLKSPPMKKVRKTDRKEFTIPFEFKSAEPDKYQVGCKFTNENKEGAEVNTGTMKIIVYDASSSSKKMTITSILPTTATLDTETDFTIKGTGFRNNTGMKCGVKGSSRSIEAKFVSETEVKCEKISFKRSGKLKATLRMFKEVAMSSDVTVSCEAPKPISAEVSKDMGALLIRFNKETTLAKRSITMSDFIETSADVGGVKARARMADRFTVAIRVPKGVNLMALKKAGKNVCVKSNELSFKCMGQRSTASYVKTCKPLDINDTQVDQIHPKAIVSGPKIVGQCSNVRLRGVSSEAGIGSVLTFAWKAYYADDLASTDANLEAINSAFKTGKTATIDPAQLKVDTNYNVTLCVTNVQLNTHCASHEFRVKDVKMELQINVRGKPARTFVSSKKINIRTSYKLKKCGKRLAGRMSYEWTASDDNLVFTAGSKTLALPPKTLPAGKTYTFTLKASASELDGPETTEASTSVSITVPSRPLQVQIGRGEKKIPANCEKTFTLSAKTRDPDDSSADEVFRWLCTQNDEPCLYEKDNEMVALPLGSSKQVSVNAITYLECGKEYVFTVMYSKPVTGAAEQREASASIAVSTVDYEPPTISGRYKLGKTDLKIFGFVKSSSAVTTEWFVIADTDAPGFIDLATDGFVKKGVTSRSFDKARKDGTFKGAINLQLDPEQLIEETDYRFRLVAKNENGDTNYDVLLRRPQTIEAGDFTVSPTEGVAMNTTFTLMASGWKGKELTYTYGYMDGKRKKILLTNTESSDIEGKNLPMGDNGVLTFFVVAKDEYGQTLRATTTMNVTESTDSADDIAKNAATQLEMDLENGNVDVALNTMRAVAQIANAKAGDTAEIIKFKKNNLVKSASMNDDSGSEENDEALLSTFGDLSNSRSDELDDVKALVTKRVIAMAILAPKLEKRKRRALGDDEDTAKYSSETQISDSLRTLTNMLESDGMNTSYSLQANELRAGYNSYVTATTASLAKLVSDNSASQEIESSESSLAAYNLKFSTTDEGSVTSAWLPGNRSHVNITEGMRSEYEQWVCLDPETCDGMILTVATITYDTLSTDVNSEIRLVSDVVKLSFNNPRNFKEIESIKTVALTVTADVKYTLIAGTNESLVRCYRWDAGESSWSRDAAPLISDGYATCSVTKVGHSAVFEYTPSEEIITPAAGETTPAPTTTTAAPTTTTAAPTTTTTTEMGNTTVMDGVDGVNVTTTANVNVTMVTEAEGNNNNATNNNETATTKSSVVTDAPAPTKKKYDITFTGNYSEIIGSNAIVKQEFMKNFSISLSVLMGINESRINVIDVYAGSIIVQFEIEDNSDKGGITIDKLVTDMKAKILAGDFNMTFNGKPFSANKLSDEIITPAATKEPQPTTTTTSSNVGLIVGCVVGGIVLIVIVVVLAIYCAKKKNKSKVEPSPNHKKTESRTYSRQGPAASPQKGQVKQQDKNEPRTVKNPGEGKSPTGVGNPAYDPEA